MKPYGILGERRQYDGNTQQVADQPGNEVTLTDPAGLESIQDKGPQAADGAAGSLYRHLGMKRWTHFPTEVRDAITQPCQAKCHNYKGGCVVHVVGPDFRKREVSLMRAHEELRDAYHALLTEFVS